MHFEFIGRAGFFIEVILSSHPIFYSFAAIFFRPVNLSGGPFNLSLRVMGADFEPVK
jgi:hypothetical protein